MAKKKAQNRIDFDNDPAYQKLVKKIKAIFDKAEAKGINLRNQRDDLFDCGRCGAYEDVLFHGGRKIFLKNKKETDKEFIVLGKKETSRTRGRFKHFTMTYDFICGVCGARQEQKFKSKFDLKELFG